MIHELNPADLEPIDRVRGIVALLQQNIEVVRKQTGIVGDLPIEFMLVLPTQQGVAVLGQLPATEFLADLAVIVEPPRFRIPSDEETQG